MKNRLWQKVQLGVVGIALMMTCMACGTLLRVIEDMYKTSPEQPLEEPVTLPTEPLKETTTTFIHTVKWRGESLSIVAAWYTDDLENWKVLAQFNPHLDPNLIFKGNKIVIPVYLLKTREPMPQDFPDKFVPRSDGKEEPSKAKAPEETAPYIHTVRWSDESLSIIAEWYTGNIENWKALAQANPDLSPERILQGDEILIPQKLLKTRQPMPQQFVEKRLSQKPTPSPTEEGEVELFGPR